MNALMGMFFFFLSFLCVCANSLAILTDATMKLLHIRFFHFFLIFNPFSDHLNSIRRLHHTIRQFVSAFFM